MKKLFTSLFVLFLTFNALEAQITTIEDIVKNPDRFYHEQVKVEGMVTRFLPGTTETEGRYQLMGDYGAGIEVKYFGRQPKINRRYRVKGVVIISREEYVEPLLIIEQNRVSPGRYTIWSIVAGLVIIASLIIYFLIQTRAKKINGNGDENGEEPGVDYNKKPTGKEEFSTIRVEKDSPPTMRQIPGKLEIMTGPDKGKVLFPLVGLPTPDGTVLSIGRDHPDWEKEFSGKRRYAHIRIKDESRTLSRNQAELIHTKDKVYLKNYSKVNPSLVDNNEVPVNTMFEIKSGSVIKAGYMEFTYQPS